MARFPVLRIVGLVALTAAAAACIRLAPQTSPDLPSAFLDRAVLCAGVVRTGGWAEPAGEKNAFSKSGDAAVCSVLVFGPVAGGHALIWKWYGPDGRLVRTSESAAVGDEGKQYDRYVAWDRLALSEAAAEGTWTVVFFVDGETAGSREFEVNR